MSADPAQTRPIAGRSAAGKRPRLLVLTPAFPPDIGGIQLLTERLVERMTAFEITVVAPASRLGSPCCPEYVVLRPPRATLRLSGLARTAALNAYAVTVAARLRPQIVLNMHIATAPAAWVIRAPYVQYVYAAELPPRPGLARRALTRAERVVAISSHSRELALRHGADPARTVTILPGVDQPASGPGGSESGGSEPEAGTSERERGSGYDIVAVARLEDHYKGHDTLIRALPLVRAVVPQARLRIVGDGRLRPYLERLAAAVDIAAAVDFLGVVPDADRDRELREAALFALPAKLPPDRSGEGFGIVFVEAGAFGLPVVAGRAAGAMDAIVDGETGVMLDDPTDHVELAGALIGLLTDADRARAMGARGQLHSRDFGWSQMAASVEQVCVGVLREGS